VLLAACAPAAGPSPSPAPAPSPAPLDALSDEALRYAAAHYLASARRLDPAAGIPRRTTADSAWHVVGINDWTSGFFGGTLWLLYEHTRDPALREQAVRWTLPLARIPQGRTDHDLGFQFHNSFGNALRITGEERFHAPVMEASRILAARFNPTVGAIRSWNSRDWEFPVIADNMMNLEMLFWAARHGGDPAWTALAIRHAETTLGAHLRPDGGSAHLVDFDTTTGAIRQRRTVQGYADGSTWARGQAWLTYGYTMAFRETRDPRFLDAARKVAAYALDRLPADRVPCWDYQAPGCPETANRDASAAAITASALLELSTLVSGEESARYRSSAEAMLMALASDRYLSRGTGKPTILLHSVGHLPAGSEVDVGINYADYYFVEALMRYRALRGLGDAGVMRANDAR
jgi:unsaturated chondroitin disaccharide hydrolase